MLGAGRRQLTHLSVFFHDNHTLVLTVLAVGGTWDALPPRWARSAQGWLDSLPLPSGRQSVFEKVVEETSRTSTLYMSLCTEI